MTPRSKILLPLAVLAVAAIAAGCGSSGGGGSANTVHLVAYSTPQSAYEKLIAAFKKTPAGKKVSFSQSYGPSGDQARSVIGGLPADYLAFSLAPDMDKLADEGLVDKNWTSQPDGGFITNSVVALVVRKGNPKGIKSWDDLLKPGIDVVTPNVFSSGSAKWNVMAAYGAFLKEGQSSSQAKDSLAKLFKNVSVQPKSGRDALTTFTGGKGDVLISYENEAIGAQLKGEKVDYIDPPNTILIQNPAAVATSAKSKKAAAAFLSFVRSDQGQKIFASLGYRPVKKSLVDTKKFPTPKELFTIDSLGGWSKVNDEFFDPTNSVMSKIEQSKGVSTSG
ncbi:MAG TPA: sulfate ABC transporter substrate-binding protein [Solirubrobacteraceae bacterium]